LFVVDAGVVDEQAKHPTHGIGGLTCEQHLAKHTYIVWATDNPRDDWACLHRITTLVSAAVK
jgi:hypothetical protein